MTDVPETSTTLLRDVADTQHVRWIVFHSRYEPMMRAFMRERFPSLDPDDIIQETFVALAKALPHYIYNPKEKGRFHNYLTGILRNKALKAIAARQRALRLEGLAAAEDGRAANPLAAARVEQNESELKAWRESVYEIALQQLLSDESIHKRTKQVFVRMTIDGETSEAVSKSLGIPRPTANRMKERMLERLRELVEALKKV